MSDDPPADDTETGDDGVASDDPVATADDNGSTATADGDPGHVAGDGSERLGERVTEYLNYALLAGLLLFALVAAANLYGAVGSAINEWVAREYRSLFRAAFNLAVLLAALAGVSYQARRLR